MTDRALKTWIKVADDRGMTLDAMADRAGYDREAILGWKKGTKIPTIYEMRDLLNAVGLELEVVRKG